MIVRVNALDPVKKANSKGERGINRYVKAVLALRALRQAVEYMESDVRLKLGLLNGGQIATAAKIVEETVMLGRATAEAKKIKGRI